MWDCRWHVSLVPNSESVELILMPNKLLDIFKFVACLFVVAIHARPLMICGEDADWALTSLCRWAVPLFFASSSYLFWSRNKQYKDFTVRLLILTGAWMVLGGYFIWERFFMHGMTYGSLVDFVKALFFSNVVSANWFITALIESMGIVWLLRKLGNKVLLLIASVCYCLSLSYGLYYPIACELGGGGRNRGVRINNSASQFICCSYDLCRDR